jgi:hypothetical protein
MDELMSILYYWDVCPALRHSHLRVVEQETQPPIRGVPPGPHTVLRQSGVMLPELSQVAVSQRSVICNPNLNLPGDGHGQVSDPDDD